jgi:hypothetical protein
MIHFEVMKLALEYAEGLFGHLEAEETAGGRRVHNEDLNNSHFFCISSISNCLILLHALCDSHITIQSFVLFRTFIPLNYCQIA